MSLQLRHYASAPLVFEHSWSYDQPQPATYRKPRGFWVSVMGEDDWPSWCAAEDFGIERLTFEHEVTLASGANILVIDSMEALRAFEARWGIRSAESYSSPSGAFQHSWKDVAIDWAGVAAESAGIIIAPYQWSARMAHDWYYGWDCASGCIWDLAAISSVQLVVSQTAVTR